MIQKGLVIPHRLNEAIQHELTDYKLLFISAGAGWGKTTGVRASLDGIRAVYVSVARDRVPRLPAKEPLVILDDFQNLSPRLEKRMAEIIYRSTKRQKIILLSRGPLPDYLLPYQYAGNLLLVTENELALNRAEVMQLASDLDAKISGDDLRRILSESHGYPPFVKFLLDNIRGTGSFTGSLMGAQTELYAYWDSALMSGLDKDLRMALLSTAYFHAVTTPLMARVLGREDAGNIMRQICRQTGILQPDFGNVWRCNVPELFYPYLKNRAEKIMAPQLIKQLYILGGDWCREQNNYMEALEHYHAAGHREMILQTVIDAVRKDNCAFELCQFADTLSGMSEDELRSAPELAYAMSRVSGLFFDDRQAQYWYHILEEMAGTPVTGASAYLAHLHLCLPQSVTGQDKYDLQAIHRDLTILPKRAQTLTAALPSILRGEREFTCLVQQPATVTGQFLFGVLQSIFGETMDSVLELLRAEYRQERGENISAALHQWEPLHLHFRKQGALDLEFVSVILTARSLCMEGQIPEAASYLLRFRHRAETAGAHELLSNVDAARCRIALMEDSVYWTRWLEEQSPTGGVVSLLDGYHLLTRVRCHIKREEYATAMLFLGRLLYGYAQHERTLDHMEALILAAICLYRQDMNEWSTYLEQALILGQNDCFVAVFSREGAAVLPLLKAYTPDSRISPQYWDKIFRKTMVQSGHCPAYLRPESDFITPLTSTEYSILLLIMRCKTIDEMTQTLGIKSSTVRTHMRNLFSKLRVHTQQDARKTAIRLKLV